MEASTNGVHEMSERQPSVASKNTRVSTKDWTLDALLSKGHNFHLIPTVDVANLGENEIERLVSEYENSGLPLLMTNFHLRPSWESEKFSPKWLRDAEGQPRVLVRNVHDREDRESSIAEYLDYAQAASPHAAVDETERLYAKDAPCPEEWHKWMLANLPEYMLPFGKGDVSAYLPPDKRVETLMTYLGIGDTYTPAHKDSCASVGQNLMVHAANDASSFWFLTSTDHSYDASVYWRKLGQELDHENHVASVQELSRAPFPIYVCKQKVGGFIIVPPRSCHQVINSGGLTMKMSWSRMTPKSCTLSLNQELPIYQRVCRPEVYRVKATIAAAISSCSEELDATKEQGNRQQLSLLERFLPLYVQMLNESYDPHWKSYSVRNFDEDSCDCCGADIWQSAMVCYGCSPMVEGNSRHGLIICGPCYVDGRSCRCGLMHPRQALPFTRLLDTANRAIAVLNSYQNDQAPIMGLLEGDLVSPVHPPFFRVANFLNRYRNSNKSATMNTCQLYRSKSRKIQGPHQNVHRIKTDQGVLCGGCHARACWYHVAEKYNTHIIEVATLSESYQALQRGDVPTLDSKSFASDAWHQHHGKDKSVKSAHRLPETPWVEWLPRLARLFRSNRPLNDTVLLGWYDGTHLGPLEPVVDPTALSNPQTPILSGPVPHGETPLKRKISTDEAVETQPRKRGRSARQRASYVDSASEDELDIIPHRSPVKWPVNTYDKPGPPPVSSTVRKPVSNQPSVLEISAAPFPMSNVPKPTKRPAASSRSVATRSTTRKTTLDTQVKLLKEQVERLTAENEVAKAQAAAASLRQEETQAEMARLWGVVRSLQAKDEATKEQ